MHADPESQGNFAYDYRMATGNRERIADAGIAIMNRIIGLLGDLWPEKGVIEHENYQLKKIKLELREQCVQNEKDNKVFENLWPFDC